MELMAALAFFSVWGNPIVAVAGGIFFALFCWGSWVGRIAVLVMLALLIVPLVLE